MLTFIEVWHALWIRQIMETPLSIFNHQKSECPAVYVVGHE